MVKINLVGPFRTSSTLPSLLISEGNYQPRNFIWCTCESIIWVNLLHIVISLPQLAWEKRLCCSCCCCCRRRRLTYCHYDFNSGLILTTDGMYQLAETWQDILRLIGCTNNLEYSWTRQSQKCTQLHSLSHWENVSERHMDHPKWLKTRHFWGPTCKRTTMTTIIILDIEPSHNVLPSCERLLIVYYRSVKLSWLSWHDAGFKSWVELVIHNNY